MTKRVCSGGENSLPVGMVLPGVQNGKSTPLIRYWELTGLLLGINRNEGSWYNNLSSTSFPLPLAIPVLIFPAVKARRE